MFVNRLILILALALPALASAASVTVSNPSIKTPPGRNAAAFFTVQSDAEDTLLSASSDCCTAVELHNHIMDGEIMRMRRVENVPLPAGEAVQFQPHGLHVMLIGLKAPLKPSDTVSLTLHFAKAPAETLKITVPAAEGLHEQHPSPTTHTH